MPEFDIRVLLNVNTINTLLDMMADLTGIAAIITDIEGNYVSKKSRYSRHCDLVHSVPEGMKACQEFAARLGAKAVETGTYAHGWCPFLLYDSIAPVIVRGKTIGFVGMGQILPEEPDLEKHRKIARRLGLNQEVFLDSLALIPRMSLEKFKKITNAFGALASILAHEALRRIEGLEKADSLSREMEMIFQNIPLGINLMTPDLDMIWFNRFLEKRIGLSTEDVKGRKCYDIVGDYRDDPNRRGAERICDECPVIRALQTGMPEKLVRRVRPDFIVENTSVPVFDSGGRVVRMVEIIRDITEKQHLEAQLLQAQKMEAVGTLAGGISHDFNNILTGILGFTQLLINRESVDEQSLSYLRRIEHEVRRASDLTSQLLTFSRRMDSRRKPVDLNKSVEQTTRILSRTLPKTIEINTSLQPDLPLINADPTQVEQILMNLAINARDGILEKEEHGTIRISTKMADLGPDFCRFHVGANPGRYALLKIKDTGIGIPADTIPRIFDPFFTTKEPGKGTGLGLAMVYGLVKAHDGYIDVHSIPGEGTVFDIYLPVISDPPADESGHDQGKTSWHGGSETILLVDDEDTILTLGRTVLEEQGYRVLTGTDGQEALEIYRSTPGIDLVILDLNMPRMNGIECLRELAKINPGIRVIICSGYSPDKLIPDVMQHVTANFLSKPFEMKKLLDLVRKMLDEQQQNTQGDGQHNFTKDGSRQTGFP